MRNILPRFLFGFYDPNTQLVLIYLGVEQYPCLEHGGHTELEITVLNLTIKLQW